MNNRNMFYQNVNQGFQSPGMVTPPSGYTMNTNYQAFGPSVMPIMNNGYPNNQVNQNYQSFEDYINDKFNTIDRQIKNLDSRVQALEANNSSTNENIYMI